MSSKSVSTTESSEREIIVKRIFEAPRSAVWKAWTEPDHLAQWSGPKGFTARVPEYDLTPGGRWRSIMIGPDGTEYPGKGVFREIVPGERIVTTDEFDEGFEKAVNMDLPQGMIVTATFSDVDGKTELTLEIAHPTAEDRRKHEEMGVVAGWNSSLDCLDEHLRSTNHKE